MTGRRRARATGAALLVAALLAAPACGGDGDGSGDDAGGAGEPAPPTTAGPPPLDVLVTNDDGVGAEGIDTVVEALRGRPGIEVTVIAPATQQSGTGGSETEGELTALEATTISGYEATAVEGFPSDTVRVALEDEGLEPDLVVSGINEGQNLGPVVDVSGTVGAARAAVRAGVPALAVSQGLGDPLDYPVAADLVLDWVDENRTELAAGTFPADAVVNLNVPTCPVGEVRGTIEVTSATAGDALGEPDCTATSPAQPADDVGAFLVGYATFTEVPPEPAAP